MSQIIAGTYEINEEIGSGGGGIVYIGKHLRLDKQVVLKADKRKLSAKPEVLRREVDALKNLSHTYIPQVYDFIGENGTVYTVMDYIDGESLDKPLERGEHFPQADVIGWACELLEALVYLHSRPPHGILHGDIKPSNIMLTPERDIRLIDFNIALALGEEGAVRVGFSRGYASPEHYGISYSLNNTHHSRRPTRKKTDRITNVLPDADTGNSPVPRISGDTRSNEEILLDVRSDIYSTGATIYHLLTGRIPDEDARNVEPIRKGECSPAVAAIVAKAMSPDPDQRYQTAEEMLAAFYELHKNNPLTKRHKRREAVAAVLIATAFATGGCATFVGLKRMERQENAYALAEYAANALRKGDVAGAISYAVQSMPENRGFLDPPYTPQAQSVLAEALGVYDLSDGFLPHLSVQLPSEPLKLSLSPDGTRMAVVYAFEVAVYELETGAELVKFPVEPSGLSDALFANADVLVYAGESGIKAYQLAENREMWTGQPATTITISGDRTRVAAVYKDESKATIYNMADGSIAGTAEFGGRSQRIAVNDTLGDPDDNLLALNHDGTMLAASFADGSLEIFKITDPDNGFIRFDPSEYTHFEGGFYDKYFAFSAWGDQTNCFCDVINVDEDERVGVFVDSMPFYVKTNDKGIFLASGNELVGLEPETGEQTKVAYTDSEALTTFSVDGLYAMIATAEKNYALFREGAVKVAEGSDENTCDFVASNGDFAAVGSRNSPFIRILKQKNHDDAQVFAYDPSYVHNYACVSADWSTVMLFSIDGFRLYRMDGELIAEVSLPEPEQIYNQQYRRDGDGSRLEVTYYDGTVQTYSAYDGSLISEEKGEAHTNNVTEGFETDRYRIVAPLHEAPQVYDKENGQLVCELEEDSLLTYVTQAENYIITQYITAEREVYGLLLDEECRTIAKLPYLCDFVDGMLVFDYPTGIMRQSRIYSIEELLSMAKNKEEF